MGRTKRRVPRSRKELRERTVEPTLQNVASSSSCPTPCTAPLTPVIANNSHCLYTPFECSVYRYPPQWCSTCQVRAASMCAQLGQPDIRMLFTPRPVCAAPCMSACQPACVRPVMCPTTQISCPSVVPLACNLYYE